MRSCTSASSQWAPTIDVRASERAESGGGQLRHGDVADIRSHADFRARTQQFRHQFGSFDQRRVDRSFGATQLRRHALRYKTLSTNDLLNPKE